MSLRYAADAFLRRNADVTTFVLISGARSNLRLDKKNRKLFGRPRAAILASIYSQPSTSVSLFFFCTVRGTTWVFGNVKKI